MYTRPFVIWVHFFIPVKGEADWFFSSKSAIYKVFTAEQIGNTLQSLYALGLDRTTKKCVIRKMEVHKMKRDITITA